MSKNKVQLQSGYSLIELFKEYDTENQCIEALFKWHWPSISLFSDAVVKFPTMSVRLHSSWVHGKCPSYNAGLFCRGSFGLLSCVRPWEFFARG